MDLAELDGMEQTGEREERASALFFLSAMCDAA
jgi:hypothetical protein